MAGWCQPMPAHRRQPGLQAGMLSRLLAGASQVSLQAPARPPTGMANPPRQGLPPSSEHANTEQDRASAA